MLVSVNIASHDLPTGASTPRAAAPFKIVMVYEDFATGLRAKQMFDHLIRDLGARLVFHSRLWKFDVLQLPPYRDMAAADAGEADLVIFAAHGTTELPNGVKTWIDQWLLQARPGPRALVSLVDTREESSTATSASCTYLREVAARGGMAYFCPRSSGPEEESGFSLERLRERAETKSSMIEEILRQTSPHPRWGINE